MTLRDLFDRLGGQAAVARMRGVSRGAVSHWVQADSAPSDHHLALWRMALEAGLEWEPPGAAELRPLLAAQLCAAPDAAPPREAA